MSADPAASCGRFSYLACDPVERSHLLDPAPGRAAPSPAGSEGSPWWIGVLPYEAQRARLERPSWSRPDPRPAASCEAIEWSRYDAVAVIDHLAGDVRVVADDEAAAERLSRALAAPPRAETRYALSIEDDEPAEQHVARVRVLLERIFDGELYQANLARRLRVRLSPCDGGAVLAAGEALIRAFPTAFGAVLRTSSAWLISMSPELLLDARPSPDGRAFERLATEPIKGTRRRAAEPALDARVARELDSDEKERAELAMIIDVERNDLARVCVPGTISVVTPPHVVTHSTLHHRVARVEGSVRPGISREQVLEALVPSGSVTGAPKVRAMEVIAELEPMRRGLYTGGLGLLARDGALRLSMAIRTVVLDERGSGEYLVGGGIVADSDPERELEETRVKAAQFSLLRAR